MAKNPHSKPTSLLKRKLGTACVLTEKTALLAASFDGSKLSFLPEAVIVAKKEADIEATLALANAHKVPVTVRGGGSSLTGSASPVNGGWVLDLSRLSKIQIDSEAGIAHVQAGAKIADIQRAAEDKGWFYPPDPSSKEHCTIGGNIACNAGGMHGAKYGVTRDYILGLEGFLPTGEHIRLAGDFKKWAAGFNLRDLWIGSEGLLGVVTSATLRLIPKPAERWTLLAAFTEDAKAMAAARALIAARVQPAILEFLDTATVECAERVSGQSIFVGQSSRPVLLLELAGGIAEVAENKAAVINWVRTHAAVFRSAENRTVAEELWAIRRKCSSAMFSMGDSKLNEDIVLPLRSYETFMEFLAKLKRKHRLPMPTFGHVADGNLHVNIMYHRDDKRESAAAVAAVDELMRGVKKLGGAISGEHGIGLAKTPFLELEHSPAAIKAMRAIKRALDPVGILNPGKIFEPFHVWKHPRLDVKLPWDHK